ncbi:MAG: asparaginase [Pseudobdellovibrionaceae bacterium]
MSFRHNSGNSYPPIEVHVTRGNFTESVHLIDAAVVDHQGQLVASFGPAETIRTYPRSAIKMLQAVNLIESGAYHRFDLNDRHLSLACSSHNGEAPHTNLVLDWLERIGMSEEDLVCGPHYPYDEKTARELIHRGLSPRPCHNNCSGKHTAFLTSMKALDWNPKHYDAFDHPLQKYLRKILFELSEEDLSHAPWGIDGCGIPTYAMSLLGMARGLRFLLPDVSVSAERNETFRLIREAVLKQPYYVGGSGDFCSDLMMHTQGRMILKSGAEGVYAGTLLLEGLSFALKVRDGNARAARVAAGALLRAFHGLTDHEFLQLSSHTQPEVKNWAGLTVGKIFVPHPLLG